MKSPCHKRQLVDNVCPCCRQLYEVRTMKTGFIRFKRLNLPREIIKTSYGLVRDLSMMTPTGNGRA